MCPSIISWKIMGNGRTGRAQQMRALSWSFISDGWGTMLLALMTLCSLQRKKGQRLAILQEAHYKINNTGRAKGHRSLGARGSRQRCTSGLDSGRWRSQAHWSGHCRMTVIDIRWGYRKPLVLSKYFCLLIFDFGCKFFKTVDSVC